MIDRERLSAAKRQGSAYTARIASRDLSADEQAVAAMLMLSRSSDAPVFEKLTPRQISARTGLNEQRTECALVKLEEVGLIRRGTDARTQEEFFSAVPPEVQYVGLRGLQGTAWAFGQRHRSRAGGEGSGDAA